MTTKDIQEELIKNNFKAPFNIYLIKDGFNIEIFNGDSKHDHLYLDYIIRGLGYKKTNEIISGNVSKTYTSIHTFVKEREI